MMKSQQPSHLQLVLEIMLVMKLNLGSYTTRYIIKNNSSLLYTEGQKKGNNPNADIQSDQPFFHFYDIIITTPTRSHKNRSFFDFL